MRLWRVRVGAPVVKGSPEGGFMTLVWRAESELVLRTEEQRLAELTGTFRGWGVFSPFLLHPQQNQQEQLVSDRITHLSPVDHRLPGTQQPC